MSFNINGGGQPSPSGGYQPGDPIDERNRRMRRKSFTLLGIDTLIVVVVAILLVFPGILPVSAEARDNTVTALLMIALLLSIFAVPYAWIVEQRIKRSYN